MLTRAKLQEVCTIYSGNSINAKEKEAKYTNHSQGTPYIATKDVGFDGVIDYSNGVSIPLDFLDSFKTAPAGATLVCAEGGSAGRKISITDREICFVNKLFALCPNQDLNQKYLFYYTMSESFQKQFKEGLSGLIGGVSLSKIKAFDISFPSLYEQQRIVAILDQAFGDIEKARANAEKNLKNARELFDSYLNQVFSQRGDSQPMVRLDSLYNIARGGSPRPIKSFITTDPDGVNWIKIGDATASGKYIYETKEKIKPEGISRSRLVKKGDFILSNSMSFGRPYIMGTDGCIHDGWLVLSAKDDSVEKNFLYHVLGSPFVFSQFDSLAAGSTVRNLNIDLVSSVKIPLLNTNEQQNIVVKLDELSANIDELTYSYKNKLASLDELKKSLLQKAFSGELTKTEGHAA